MEENSSKIVEVVRNLPNKKGAYRILEMILKIDICG
jgi:hypothetical protein